MYLGSAFWTDAEGISFRWHSQTGVGAMERVTWIPLLPFEYSVYVLKSNRLPE